MEAAIFSGSSIQKDLTFRTVQPFTWQLSGRIVQCLQRLGMFRVMTSSAHDHEEASPVYVRLDGVQHG